MQAVLRPTQKEPIDATRRRSTIFMTVLLALNGVVTVIVSVGAMLGARQPSIVRPIVRGAAVYVLLQGLMSFRMAFTTWRRRRGTRDST